MCRIEFIDGVQQSQCAVGDQIVDVDRRRKPPVDAAGFAAEQLPIMFDEHFPQSSRRPVPIPLPDSIQPFSWVHGSSVCPRLAAYGDDARRGVMQIAKHLHPSAENCPRLKRNPKKSRFADRRDDFRTGRTAIIARRFGDNCAFLASRPPARLPCVDRRNAATASLNNTGCSIGGMCPAPGIAAKMRGDRIAHPLSDGRRRNRVMLADDDQRGHVYVGEEQGLVKTIPQGTQRVFDGQWMTLTENVVQPVHDIRTLRSCGIAKKLGQHLIGDRLRPGRANRSIDLLRATLA